MSMVNSYCQDKLNWHCVRYAFYDFGSTESFCEMRHRIYQGNIKNCLI